MRENYTLTCVGGGGGGGGGGDGGGGGQEEEELSVPAGCLLVVLAGLEGNLTGVSTHLNHSVYIGKHSGMFTFLKY